MKKYYIMLVVFIVFGLNGCSVDKTKSIRETVDSFYQAYYDEDLDEMLEYVYETKEGDYLPWFKELGAPYIHLDVTNDFTYEIDSIVEGERDAYVNVKFVCHDLSKLLMDDDSGFDYLQYNFSDIKDLTVVLNHYKSLMDNNVDYKFEFTEQIKMIKIKNKWYFDTDECDIMAPICRIENS